MEWQTPPSDKRHTTRSEVLDRVADELKANPGNWARVARAVPPGRAKAYSRRGLEVRFTCVAVVDGQRRHDIYARYNPELRRRR